jgi:hypothetical protein
VDKLAAKACSKCLHLRPVTHNYCSRCGAKLMRGVLELWDTAGDAGPAGRRPGKSTEDMQSRGCQREAVCRGAAVEVLDTEYHD